MSTLSTPAAHESAVSPESGDPAFLWLHDAAVALGADAATAQDFARSGQLQLNGVLLCVQPRSDQPDDWLAMARVERPASVAHERWCDALLTANGSLMLLAPWAFAIDDEGAALLALRVPPAHCDDPLMLCGSLFGLLWTAEGLVQGLAGPQTGATPAAGEAAGAEPGTAEEADAAIAAAMAQPAFTAAMETLVCRAVEALGGDAATQRQALEQGSLRVGPASIAVVGDIEGQSLVLSAEVGPAVALDAKETAAVLAGNLDLLALAGVAIGRLSGLPVLSGRWDMDDATDDLAERAELFAAWLIDFAELSQAIGAAATAGRRQPVAARRPA
ncbi:MAG TPA: hypothetical protein VIN58_10505 [Roseateles sp.]